MDAEHVSDTAPRYDFSDLSPNAKAAFLDALHAPDGSAAVYGSGNRPPEFSYGDVTGWYFVRYQGEYYELESHDGGGALFRTARFGLFALPAGVALAVAGRSFLQPRPRLAPAVLVAYLVLLATFEVNFYALSDDTQLVVGAALTLAIVPAVATWYALGWLYETVWRSPSATA